MMDRRGFLANSIKTSAILGIAPLLGNVLRAGAEPTNVSIRIHPDRKTRQIPNDFVGLGYEISSVAKPGLLAGGNRPYVQLVRNLGASGVIRVGGATSDNASFVPNGAAKSLPKGTVVNQESLRQLRSFLLAVGWKLIWGLNLGEGSVQDAVEESQAVASIIGDKLLAFEIGNEPDLFRGGHRPKGWAYSDYLVDYRQYKAAIRARLPEARFAGPDTAGSTDWVESFSRDEGQDILLLTEHYYLGPGGSEASTEEKMLGPDPKIASISKRLEAISSSSHLPYRICETNSFYNGGRPGVSDTFGSALWVLDYMFGLASAGAGGVNMETGVNHLGFISHYSPIGEDSEKCFAAPEYYGMLAFAQGSQGELVDLDVEQHAVNLTAYAVARNNKQVVLTVINKDESRDASIGIQFREGLHRASAIRLAAPSVQSKNGITFGGASVDPDGNWKVARQENVKVIHGNALIALPASSAAIVKFDQ
jgi:hypothetical protein